MKHAVQWKPANSGLNSKYSLCISVCIFVIPFFLYILPIYHLKDLRQIYIFLGCNLLSSTAAPNSSSVSSIGKKAACYVSNNLLLYYPKTRPKSLLLAKKSFYIDKTDVENEFLNLNVRIIFSFLLLFTNRNNPESTN